MVIDYSFTIKTFFASSIIHWLKLCPSQLHFQFWNWHRSIEKFFSSSKMKFLTLTLFSLSLNSCWSYQVIRELRKQINDGEILGRYVTSETGRTVSAFIGIPFASPPVEDLRFRAPQKVTPWNGTLLTQNQRSKCPQIDTFAGSTVYEGDEDCLYVNVYVPETNSNTRLDVLVWIHGGVVLENSFQFTLLNMKIFRALP